MCCRWGFSRKALDTRSLERRSQNGRMSAFNNTFKCKEEPSVQFAQNVKEFMNDEHILQNTVHGLSTSETWDQTAFSFFFFTDEPETLVKVVIFSL